MVEGFLNVAGRLFQKRYTFYYSVIGCILVASVYIALRRTQYQISYTVHSDIPFDTVYSRIKSKDFVQKVIDRLPFEVNYYWERAPREEIFGDSLPIRIIANKSTVKKYEEDLQIHSLSSHSYSVEHKDTIQFYEIGEAVQQYYGDFKLQKGPAFKSHFASLIIRINQPGELANSYYQNLTIDRDSGTGTIRFSLVAANPLKGQAFLNELIGQYNAANQLCVKGHNYKDSLIAVEQKLALLKSFRGPKPVRDPDKQQIKTLEVIKPYVEKPLRQFVQVPYIDELKNKHLQSALEKFNKTEVDKQHFLSAGKVDDLAIAHFDRQLELLKTEILDQITNQPPDRSQQHSLKRAEDHYKKLIADQSGFDPESTLLALHRPAKNDIHIQVAGLNFAEIYIIAVALGFLLPLGVAFIVNLDFTIIRGDWFNSHTFSEKLKILFGISRSTDA